MSGLADTLVNSALTAQRGALGLATPARHDGTPWSLDTGPNADQRDWRSAIEHAMASTAPRASGPDPRLTKVEKNVEELVANTLIMPVLKSLHNNPLASGLFPDSPATKSLGPLLEGEVAKSMAAKMTGPFVDQVARRLLDNLGRRASATDGQVTPLVRPQLKGSQA